MMGGYRSLVVRFNLINDFFGRKQQRSKALTFSPERRKIKGLRSFLAAPFLLLNVEAAVAEQERHRRLAAIDNPIF